MKKRRVSSPAVPEPPPQVWKARREAFSGDFPVSTLVVVRALAAPELLVEVEPIAVLGAGGS